MGSSPGKNRSANDLYRSVHLRIVPAGVALEHRDAQRSEIVGAHGTPKGKVVLPCIAADDLEFVEGEIGLCRQDGVQRGGTDARNRRQPLKRAQLSVGDGFRPLAPRRAHPERQDVIRIETWRDLLQARKASNEESGADEQHDGERHLRHDERALKQLPASQLTAPTARQMFGHVASSCPQRRDQREQHRRDDAERERERDEPQVQVHLFGTRQSCRRGPQGVDSPPGQQQTHDRSGE
jgi:hypothetical protein